MMGMKIKQKYRNFQLEYSLSILKPASRYNPVIILVLDLVLQIFVMKKICKIKRFE